MNIEAAAALAGPVTQDAFLGGRVVAFQPAEGFRAAIDTVCLAAAVDPARGARILDVGAGAGIASLCLAARRPQGALTLLEIDERLGALSRVNLQRNGIEAQTVCDDLFTFSRAGEIFDQVMTNPPFLADGVGTPPPHAMKARAHVGAGAGADGLAPWIGACLALTAAKGTLTLICRGDQLDAAVPALTQSGAGAIEVFPLWPGPGKPARRLVIRARKGVKSPSRLLPGLMLHAPGERYTAAAEAVLRDGEGLPWDGI